MWGREYPPRLSGPSLRRRQESNPGEADGRQTGARADIHTRTHMLGELQSARRGTLHGTEQETGVSLWATLAFKLKIILPFIPDRTTLSCRCRSLDRFSTQVYKLRPGVCFRDDLHTLDHAFGFPVDPRSLERSEARLYATFPGSDWRQRRAGERLAPHRQLMSSHTESTAR